MKKPIELPSPSGFGVDVNVTDAVPVASVVTTTLPRNTSPSAKPDAFNVWLAKNSILYGPLGRVCSTPLKVTPAEPQVELALSTGKFCGAAQSGRPSAQPATSFGDTPLTAKSMPRSAGLARFIVPPAAPACEMISAWPLL